VYPAFNPLIYGLVNRLERSLLLDRFVKYNDECKIDMPQDDLLGMTRVEARVGRVQVPRTERKREIVARALAHGVQLGELIEQSCADMPACRDRPGNRYDCPIARKLSETTINLPGWEKLSARHHKIVRVVRGFLECGGA